MKPFYSKRLFSVFLVLAIPVTSVADRPNIPVEVTFESIAGTWGITRGGAEETAIESALTEFATTELSNAFPFMRWTPAPQHPGKVLQFVVFGQAGITTEVKLKCRVRDDGSGTPIDVDPTELFSYTDSVPSSKVKNEFISRGKVALTGLITDQKKRWLDLFVSRQPLGVDVRDRKDLKAIIVGIAASEFGGAHMTAELLVRFQARKDTNSIVQVTLDLMVYGPVIGTTDPDTGMLQCEVTKYYFGPGVVKNEYVPEISNSFENKDPMTLQVFVTRHVAESGGGIVFQPF